MKDVLYPGDVISDAFELAFMLYCDAHYSSIEKYERNSYRSIWYCSICRMKYDFTYRVYTGYTNVIYSKWVI